MNKGKIERKICQERKHKGCERERKKYEKEEDKIGRI